MASAKLAIALQICAIVTLHIQQDEDEAVREWAASKFQ
jgi:hypothetical protein